MTRKFASNYVFVPGQGFLRLCGVTVEDGYVVRVFRLAEETESVEWHPGVIVLREEESGKPCHPYLYYPFDFTRMQPVAGTRCRRLQ